MEEQVIYLQPFSLIDAREDKYEVFFSLRSWPLSYLRLGRSYGHPTISYYRTE